MSQHLIDFLTLESTLRLHLNENSYELPDSIIEEATFAAKKCSRYPVGKEDEIIQKIARKFSVPQASILLTHGIDEAIDRLIQHFSSMRFVIFEPTFDGYLRRLQVNGQFHCVMRLNDSFGIDESSLEHLTFNDFVILANPNNPTGQIFDDEVIGKILHKCGMLLIDETYIDFSDCESWIARQTEKILIFKSFSKSYGLAGLRLGVVIGNNKHKDEISQMRSRQWYCNVGSIPLAILSKALESDYYKINVAKTIQERERMMAAFSSLGIEIIPTHTNFILVKDGDGQLLKFLNQKHIYVKDAALLGLEGYLRITLADYEKNNQLLETLKEFKLTLCLTR